MLWPLLAGIFGISILLGLILVVFIIFRPPIWRHQRAKILVGFAAFFIPYAIFILFFTGPTDLSVYPPAQDSPFKLPWAGGVSRFASQGNRSFTSHRGIHLNAWDFVMPIGTPVLAAADGKVVRVEMDHDGIGILSNIIVVAHPNGIHTGYAHLKKDSEQVKVGDDVKQGQVLAQSGLTGQTPFPHLHFFATNSEDSEPRPISFQEVEGGVPFAGHYYTSGNREN